MRSTTPKKSRFRAVLNGKGHSNGNGSANGANGNGSLTDGSTTVYTTSELFAQFMSDTGKTLNQIVTAVQSDPAYFNKSDAVESLSDKWTLTTVTFDEAIEAIYNAQLRLTNITLNPNFSGLGDFDKDSDTLYKLVFSLLQPDTGDGAANPTGASVASSFDVTRYVASEFVDFYYALFAISGDTEDTQAEERASTFYNSAANIRSAVMYTYFGVQASSGDNIRQVPWNNLGDKSSANYDGLPNFEGLFGEENFISVDEFESVLSPAAYLVDLEKARQENISKVDSSVDNTDLSTRRPDIYDVILTADNTTTEVPKINLVIKALEDQLGNLPIDPIKDPVNDLSEATVAYPFAAPFNYNHQQIFRALELLQTDLATLVVKASNPSSPTVPTWQNWDMSTNMYLEILKTFSSDMTELGPRFGLEPTASLSAITPLLFQVKAGIDAEDLADVVYGDLSDGEIRNSLDGSLYPNQGLDADNLSISYDDSSKSYLFENASVTNLDRANRMVRLAQLTGLSYAELNWLLTSLFAVRPSTTSTTKKRRKKSTADDTTDLLTLDSTYEYLAGVQAVQAQYKLSINAAAALIGQLKYQGEENGTPLLFSLFGSSVPDQNKWNSTATTGTDAQTSSTIAKALGLSAADLQSLVAYMVGSYGQKVTQIDLSAQNSIFLSGLYRAALYCQLRSISVDNLLYLLQALDNDFLALPTDLSVVWTDFQALESFVDQLSEAGISVDTFQEMSTATKDTSNPLLPASSTVTSAAQALVAQMTSDVMLTRDNFITVMVVQVPAYTSDQYGTTYDTLQSKQYFDSNVDSETGTNLGIVLKAPVSSTDMAAIVKPLSGDAADQAQFEAAINQTLLSYQEKQMAISQSVFQNTFSLNSEQAATVADWYQLYPNSTSPEDANVLYAFQRLSIDEQTLYYAAMQRFANLINAYDLSQAEINFILAKHSALSVADDYDDFAIDAAALQNIGQIHTLIQQYSDPDNLMLAALVPSAKTSISDLVKATHWDSTTLTNILTNWGNKVNSGVVTLTDPVTVLTGVNNLLQYGQQVGLDPVWMQGFNAQFTTVVDDVTSGVNNEALELLANQTTDAVYALNGSASAEGIDNSLIFPLTSAYRDLLISALLNGYANSKKEVLEAIQDTNSLSEYLLTDVEVTSKFTTSAVKDAIGVFQTFFYRVIMHLESNFTIDPDFVATEWPYFRTYRLWEANREIFVNPENYVRPDLKPKSSSIYQDFISTLKQGKINAENIEQAFSNYLQSFTEVSGLSIVSSSCSTISNQQCTISFIGYSVATSNFFYRTLDCAFIDGAYTPTGWSTWKKIDVAIAASRVQLARIDDRLLILWFEVQSSDVSESPTNNSDGYVKGYEIKVNYSYLQVSGNWTNARTIMNLPVSNDQSQNVYNDKTSFVQSLLNQAQLSITPNAKDLVIGLTYAGYAYNNTIDIETSNVTATFPNKYVGNAIQAEVTLYSDLSIGNLQLNSDGAQSTFTATYLGTTADLAIPTPLDETTTPVAYQMARHYNSSGIVTTLSGLGDFHQADSSQLLINGKQNPVYQVSGATEETMLFNWGDPSYAPGYNVSSKGDTGTFANALVKPIEMAYWFRIDNFTSAETTEGLGGTEKRITLSFVGQTSDTTTPVLYWQLVQTTSATAVSYALILYAQSKQAYLTIDLEDFQVGQWYYVSQSAGVSFSGDDKSLVLYSASAGKLRIDNNGQCYLQELGYRKHSVEYTVKDNFALNNQMIMGINVTSDKTWIGNNADALGPHDAALRIKFQNIQVNNLKTAVTFPGMPIQKLPNPTGSQSSLAARQGLLGASDGLGSISKNYLIEWKGTDADKDSNSLNYTTAYQFANAKNYSPGISSLHSNPTDGPAISGVNNPYYRLCQSGTYSTNRQHCIRVYTGQLADLNSPSSNYLQVAFWFRVINTNNQKNVVLFFSPAYDQKSFGNAFVLNTNETGNATPSLTLYANYVGSGNANNKSLWTHTLPSASLNNWFYVSSIVSYSQANKQMTLKHIELGELTTNAFNESAINIFVDSSTNRTSTAPAKMSNYYYVGISALEDANNPFSAITGSNPNFKMITDFTGIQISNFPDSATSPGVPDVDATPGDFPLPFQNSDGMDMTGRYVPNSSAPNTAGLVTTTEMQYLTLPTGTNAATGTDWRYIRMGSNLTPYLESIYQSQSFDGLFSIDTQLQTEPIFADLQPNTDETNATYRYNTVPRSYWPVDGYLDLSSADAQYYWELFHHAPLLIAQMYQESGNYTEAQRWYQYVFNPQQTTENISATEQKSLDKDSNSDRDIYWRFIGLRTFYDMLLSQEIYAAPGTEFLEEGSNEEVDTKAGAEGSTFYNDLQNQAVQTYLNDPFDADAIAMLRPKAYQEATVMNYIQNLISQGDVLYTEQTRESIQEAYIFYTEAYNLLGQQPESEGNFSDLQDNSSLTLNSIDTTYSQANQSIQEFLVGLEASLSDIQSTAVQALTGDSPYNWIPGLYFGIPQNQQLLGLWSTLDSRFYNLRNNLDINGNPMQLALFEPPINPLTVEEGLASGRSLSADSHLLSASAPNYRFYVQLQRAQA
ncbi:MAG: neuraminidase-like domain-containing protein, partial [Bacteroidota bacterium]